MDLPEDADLRALLEELARRYPGFGETVFNTQVARLREQVLITHNGRLLASLSCLDIRLEDGDRVGFVPAYSGG